MFAVSISTEGQIVKSNWLTLVESIFTVFTLYDSSFCMIHMEAVKILTASPYKGTYVKVTRLCLVHESHFFTQK